jgi:hypothetical protein
VRSSLMRSPRDMRWPDRSSGDNPCCPDPGRCSPLIAAPVAMSCVRGGTHLHR